MYICVDFDGTVVDHAYPGMGEPVPGAVPWMREWARLGAKIILFTMRSGVQLREAVEYMRENGVELYGANWNPSQGSWTDSPKAYGQLYVDDAAFGCPLCHPPGFNRRCVDWSVVGPAVFDALDKEEG
jgi:hypothetical protein